MPIKPENKKLYPANWKEIRQQILERAGHKCEFCGLPNHIKVVRTPIGGTVLTDTPEKFTRFEGYREVRIVLTIAHLDHDPTNNDPQNLRALCQQCHLRYDKEHHAQTRRKTRGEDKWKIF